MLTIWHSIFEIASLLTAAAGAAFWLLSARVKLTPVGFGLEELDKVAAVSAQLQQMGRWNFWAALFTACASIFQIFVQIV